MVRAAGALKDKVSALEEELASELTRMLAEAGVSGSAVKVNPQTHPRYTERLAQAAASVASDLEKAKAAYAEALREG